MTEGNLLPTSWFLANEAGENIFPHIIKKSLSTRGIVLGHNHVMSTISRLPWLPAVNGQRSSAHPGPVSCHSGVEVQADVPVIIKHVCQVLDMIFDDLPFMIGFQGYEVTSVVLTGLPCCGPCEAVLVKRVTGTFHGRPWNWSVVKWTLNEMNGRTATWNHIWKMVMKLGKALCCMFSFVILGASLLRSRF